MDLPNIHNQSSDEEIVGYLREVKLKHSADAAVAANLARTLAVSGCFVKQRMPFSADVASTGGPSSLSTLLCPLYLLVAGAVVPKLGIPGRPAGGIDCLAQVEGYRYKFSTSEIEVLLDESKYAHFLANDVVAPLDERVFRLRQQCAAQDVPTLVIASILSKKIAVGVSCAGLDVRVANHGNFGRSWSEAKENARLFVEAGRLLGIKAFPILTDGQLPYQPFIGRSEALVALSQIFSGEGGDWLNEHNVMCRDIALACTPPENRNQLLKARPADLQEAFLKNLVAQGASLYAYQRIVESSSAGHIYKLCADNDGFTYFDLSGIRSVMVGFQNRVNSSMNLFQDPVGVVLQHRANVWVEKNEVIATVRVAAGVDAAEVVGALEPYVSKVSSTLRGLTIKGDV